jgi:hypothetical protein
MDKTTTASKQAASDIAFGMARKRPMVIDMNPR